MADNRSGPSRRVETQLDTTLESVDAAENLVLEGATEAGFSEEDQHKIGIAVRESMVNAVVHGNRYNLKKKIYLGLDIELDRLTVVIRDEGEGFESSDLPDPLAEENLLRQSGRGLLLIKAFAAHFAMRKVEPLGTEVTMVFDKQEIKEA